jgi:hypothetical protein
MSCPSFDDVLESLADDPALESVRVHVGGCPACRHTVGRITAVFRLAALYEEYLAGASQKMPSRWARSIAKRVHAAFEAHFTARPTCPGRDDLFDWLVGDAESDPAIGPHLAMCDRCQQAMGEIAALVNGASQWDIVTAPPAPTADEPMPIELSDRVFATVNAAYQERFAVTPRGVVVGRETIVRPAKRLPRYAIAAFASAAALLLAVGGVIWQTQDQGFVDVASREPNTVPSVITPPLPEVPTPATTQPATAPAIVVAQPQPQPQPGWTLAESATAVAAQLQKSAQPILNIARHVLRPPTADDWNKVAAKLAARAKQARSRGQYADEQRHLVDTLAAARAANSTPARQAAYGLLLVRNQLDQNQPDAALATFDNLPATNAAEIRKARSHLASRLAKTFHDRGRSAISVIVLSSLDGELDASTARTLADAQRAVAAQTTRLVGTGNQALTHKVERWAQSRLAQTGLAGSLAQTTR